MESLQGNCEVSVYQFVPANQFYSILLKVLDKLFGPLYSLCMPKSISTQQIIEQPTKTRGSLYWDTPLMLAVEALADEQGRSFNEYLALLAARQVAIVERRRQRKNVPTPEAA